MSKDRSCNICGKKASQGATFYAGQSRCKKCSREASLAKYREKHPVQPKPEKEVLPAGQKRCLKCNQIKPHRDYAAHSTATSGLHPYCKRCMRIISRIKNYGLTPEEAERYEDEIATAECELCGRTATDAKMNLDHDHKTGQVRGWLCTRCNGMLGSAEDDIYVLERAVAYLKRYLPKS